MIILAIYILCFIASFIVNLIMSWNHELIFSLKMGFYGAMFFGGIFSAPFIVKKLFYESESK